MKLDLGIFLVMNAMDDLTPHPGGVEYVCLVNRMHTTATGFCSLECLACNALNFVFTILKGVDGALTLGAVGTSAFLVEETLALAKVQTARELTYDNQIDAIDDLGLQGRGTGKGVENLNGAKVGVEAQLLADLKQTLLRARLGGISSIPLRAADRGKKNRIACLRAIKGCLGQGLARGIDGAAADQGILVFEANTVFGADGIEHLNAFSHDLGTDTVAGKSADFVISHKFDLSFS